MQSWTIASPLVSADVQALGGMMGPARFRLGEREVSPLAVAPWAGEAGAKELPGILQRLRGEWACVPFGIAGGRDLPPGWEPQGGGDEPDSLPHGVSSNGEWTALDIAPARITLEIVYPASHPIERLRRTIVAASDAPCLDFTLEIVPRRDCVLPIGIHPTFALPGNIGDCRLVLDPGASLWTPPAPVEPGISRMAVDARDVPLTAVPLAAGGTVDASRLPLATATEELLLATHANGRARLECSSAGYAATLTWDRDVFASCMLWISNRGRTAYPWSGRHLALGIEPVTAAFDLGTAVSANQANPLAAAGVSTARQFYAGERVVTRYAIAVEPLD
jgi:hypothetical protein